MKYGDLVSITVISYNSSDTIIETLDSIKEQSYQNIELIISDDCSTDDTVNLCIQWGNVNRGRFSRFVILEAEKNEGICRNANKAKGQVEGEWVHGIAADDILFSNAIEDFVMYILDNTNASLVTSFCNVYNETFEEKNCTKKNFSYRKLEIFDKDAQTQAKLMAHDVFIYGPTVMMRMDMFTKLGGFDERYAYEDQPFYLTAMENGYKCYFLPKVTAGYRVHQSVGHAKGRLFNPRFISGYRTFVRERAFAYFTRFEKIGELLIWFMQDLLIISGLNRDNAVMKFLYQKAVNLIRRIFKNDGRKVL